MNASLTGSESADEDAPSLPALAVLLDNHLIATHLLRFHATLACPLTPAINLRPLTAATSDAMMMIVVQSCLCMIPQMYTHDAS